MKQRPPLHEMIDADLLEAKRDQLCLNEGFHAYNGFEN